MIKQMMKRLITSLCFLSTLAYAIPGPLFSIAASGNPAAVDIVLCLNGIGPVSCQNYHVTAETLHILTTTNHFYHFYVAGIKVLTPGYQPSGCFPYVNGYCLFLVSNTTVA